MNFVERWVILSAVCFAILLIGWFIRFLRSEKPISKHVKIGLICTVLVTQLTLIHSMTDMRLVTRDNIVVFWIVIVSIIWTIIFGYRWINKVEDLEAEETTSDL